MTPEAFTLAGFESRRNQFYDYQFVPGSDAYVGRMSGGYYAVGVLGHTDARRFLDVNEAASAAKQLAGVPASNAAPNVKAYDAFWGPFQGHVGAVPPLPHPDGSNQGLGPNVGGADGVVLPTDTIGSGGTGPSGSGVGSLLLIGGVVVLAVVLLGRK